jgi:hypothetical protein
VSSANDEYDSRACDVMLMVRDADCCDQKGNVVCEKSTVWTEFKLHGTGRE